MSYMKQLKDQRDAKAKEMKDILDGAKTENRAMNEEEQQKWDALDKEIKNIDKTIEAEKRAIEMNGRKKEHGKAGGVETEDEKKEREAMEERAFVNFILGNTENRAEGGEYNLSADKNGAVIPTSIADKIIKEVKERCPILEGATLYYVQGDLKVPVWGADEEGNNIKAGYGEDFAQISANAGKFTSVDLSGYLVNALALIGDQMETNAAFNVTDFIVEQLAEDIVLFLEGELLKGKTKISGATNTKTVVQAGSATAVTADDLIKLQTAVKQVFQKNACWTMNRETLLAVRLLKDGNDRYLLQDNLSQEFPYTLLGKPVHVSENMEGIATGAKPIMYGDYKGLSVNIRKNMKVQVLRERYADINAIGVIGKMEIDAEVTDHQRLAVLQMA